MNDTISSRTRGRKNKADDSEPLVKPGAAKTKRRALGDITNAPGVVKNQGESQVPNNFKKSKHQTTTNLQGINKPNKLPDGDANQDDGVACMV